MIRSPFAQDSFNFNWFTMLGPGVTNSVVITNQVNTRAEFMGGSFQFVTDANVADRFLRVVVQHSIFPIELGGSDVGIPASKTVQVVIGQTGHGTNVFNEDTHYICIPSFPFLTEGDTITISIVNAQAADAIAVSHWVLKTWIFEQ